MPILSLIPAQWRLLAAAAALAAAAMALLAWGASREADGREKGYSQGMVVAARVQATLDSERRDWAEKTAAAAEVARLAALAARTEEQRRVAALQEALDAAELQARRERADRAIADAAAGRLRDRVADLVTAARFSARNPGLAIGGAPADDAAGVLADVLGRCETRVRVLAGVADERGRAGQLCVNAYDALTPATAASAPAPAAAD